MLRFYKYKNPQSDWEQEPFCYAPNRKAWYRWTNHNQEWTRLSDHWREREMTKWGFVQFIPDDASPYVINPPHH